MSNVRRIIRANRVILKASETLESIAQSFIDCETVDGVWEPGTEEAQAEVEEILKVAHELRSLLKKGGA